MKVTITQENIDKGRRAVADSCPVALALRTMGFARAVVYADDVTIWDNSGWRAKYTGARRFVTAFDGNETVEPCTLILRRKGAWK